MTEGDEDGRVRDHAPTLESERRWAELFARPGSEDLLEGLADEALSEHRAGRTRPLNVDDL